MIIKETINIIAFLRGYPDIDHITPVIHKLAEASNVKLKIFAVNPFYNYSRNNKIDYLKKVAEYHNVVSLFDQKKKILYWICKYYEGVSEIFDKVILLNLMNKRVLYRLKKKITDWVDNLDPNRILDFLEIHEGKCIMIFDHSASDLYKNLAIAGRKRNILSIAFPHSVEVWSKHNELRTINMLSLKKDSITEHQYNFFDYVLYTNQYTLEKEVEKGLDRSKAVNLGSCRFSNGWVRIRDKLIPERKYTFPVKGNGGMKVLLLCPKQQNNIFWEELLRTINIISSYGDTRLAMKLPARGKSYYFPKKMYKIHNIDFLDESFSSSSLMKWADVIFFVETSVFFEGYLLKKPVIQLNYLHINKFFFDGHPALWTLNCRDDLFYALDQLMINPSYKPYKDEAVDNLLNYTVKVAGKNPLDEYKQFILKITDSIEGDISDEEFVYK